MSLEAAGPVRTSFQALGSTNTEKAGALLEQTQSYLAALQFVERLGAQGAGDTAAGDAWGALKGLLVQQRFEGQLSPADLQLLKDAQGVAGQAKGVAERLAFPPGTTIIRPTKTNVMEQAHLMMTEAQRQRDGGQEVTYGTVIQDKPLLVGAGKPTSKVALEAVLRHEAAGTLGIAELEQVGRLYDRTKADQITAQAAAQLHTDDTERWGKLSKAFPEVRITELGGKFLAIGLPESKDLLGHSLREDYRTLALENVIAELTQPGLRLKAGKKELSWSEESQDFLPYKKVMSQLAERAMQSPGGAFAARKVLEGVEDYSTRVALLGELRDKYPSSSALAELRKRWGGV